MAVTADRPRPTQRGMDPSIVEQPHEKTEISAFAQLLKIESEARRARSIREIDALVVNEGQRLLRSRQAFIVDCAGRQLKVTAASSIVTVDASSPMIGWVLGMIRQMLKERGLAEQVEFSLPGYAATGDDLTLKYPFRNVLWQPLWSPDGKARAGMLFFRDTPWLAAERSITARLAETFGHARAFLHSTRFQPAIHRHRKLYVLAGTALAAAVAAIPIPISVLAPLEVVPRHADVIAMPFEGIVQQVLVQPSSVVAAGTPLVRLADTVLRNRAEIAARDAEVAAARVEKATSLAFTDPRGREELGIARTELKLKQAELSYARELLGQTIIKAEKSGIAVFSDPRELEGRPLTAGERLMLIAGVGERELRISVPVSDSIVLKPGLTVKGFLDSDPLSSVSARVASIDHHVRVDEMQIASYRVTARVSDDSGRLTLGARGTAQIQGEYGPLILYVLRRPLTALRQWIGL